MKRLCAWILVIGILVAGVGCGDLGPSRQEAGEEAVRYCQDHGGVGIKGFYYESEPPYEAEITCADGHFEIYK